MRPPLSTVTVYPTSVSSPALVHIYNTPLADPPPCPIHTGPKHSILTHWEHRAPAHGQQGIISMYVLPPGVKKNKNKKEIYTTENSACLFCGFFDMITVMLLNIISSSHGLLGTVHMCICKHVSSLGAYSWVRLSKAEWLSNEINTPEETKEFKLLEETERVLRWMKKISTEALKK